jgi:hypothetical protein
MRIGNCNGFLGALQEAMLNNGGYESCSSEPQVSIVEKRQPLSSINTDNIEQLVDIISESTRKAAEIGATDDNRVLIVNNFNFIFVK